MEVSMQMLDEISEKFDIKISPLEGNLSCAFVGEWNHGKSSLINSLIGSPILPNKRIPTTKTIVKLSKSTNQCPQAIVYENSEEKKEYQGQAAIDALKLSTQSLMCVEYSDPQLHLPLHTVLIDTPGFNDTDQSTNTIAETVHTDIIVFVLSCKVSALNQTQINFIQQAILCKAEVKDLFFVFTHSDLLDDEKDYDDLRERVGNHISNENIFFLSNKNQQGIQAFKDVLYDYINERKKTLLEYREQRYKQQLIDALRPKVIIGRSALTRLKKNNACEQEKLRKKIQEAHYKERYKKNELRSKSQSRLQHAQQKLRVLRLFSTSSVM